MVNNDNNKNDNLDDEEACQEQEQDGKKQQVHENDDKSNRGKNGIMKKTTSSVRPREQNPVKRGVSFDEDALMDPPSFSQRGVSSDDETLTSIAKQEKKDRPQWISEQKNEQKTHFFWQQRYGGWVLQFHQKLNEKIFMPLFLHIADHPYAYVVFTIVLSLGLAALAVLTGSVRLATRVHETAVPRDSYTLSQRNFIFDHFRNLRISSALVYHEGGGNGDNNVLTVDGISMAFHVHEIRSRLETLDKFCKIPPEPFSFHDNTTTMTTTLNENESKEEKDDWGDCEFQSVTRFWYDRNHFEQEMSLWNTTEQRNVAIQKTISSPVFIDGDPVVREIIFGQYQTNDDDTIVYAASLATTLIVPAPPRPKTLERSWGKLIDEVNTAQQEIHKSNQYTLRVAAYNQATLDKDLSEPVLKDLPLVGAAGIIMMLFTAIAMTRWAKNSKGQRFVTSNFLLGIGATVTVILSTMTGYSICLLCGYPITTLTQTLPFILFGIGLDDAFVLVGAYYETNGNLGFKARLKAMTHLAAPSITATTMTDCLAFAFGAATSIPAIRWFSFYAVVCVLVDFLFQITFFMALLVLDHERSKQGRYDCLICVKAPTPTFNQSTKSLDSNPDQIRPQQRKRRRVSLLASVREARRSNSCMSAYADFLLHPIVKIVVLLGFMTLFVFGAYFASNVTVNFQVTDYTPNDAQTDRYSFAHRDFFAQSPSGEFSANVFYHDLEFEDPNTRKEMESFRMELLNLGNHLIPQPYWLADFEQFVRTNNHTTHLTFAQQLDLFLHVDAFQTLYGTDLIRSDDNDKKLLRVREGIVIARQLDDARSQVDFLVEQRRVTVRNALNQNLQGQVERAFMYFAEFPLYAHYEILPRELAIALVCSVVAVVIVSLLLLPHITGALLSMLVIIWVDVELIGIIYLAGYNINTVTVILLIMSIGLVADYCMHIVHAFLHVDAMDRRGRSKLALLKMGGSVFLGGLSTFLGILALSLADGQVFFVFFVMFVSMVLLGVAHGLVFLPVVLSYVGPDFVVMRNKMLESTRRLSTRFQLSSSLKNDSSSRRSMMDERFLTSVQGFKYSTSFRNSTPNNNNNSNNNRSSSSSNERSVANLSVISEDVSMKA